MDSAGQSQTAPVIDREARSKSMKEITRSAGISREEAHKRCSVRDGEFPSYTSSSTGSHVVTLKGKPELVSRRSMLNMNSTIRTIKIKDILEGMGFVYKRSSEWGRDFPDANGDNQSPINIDSRDTVFCETLNKRALVLNYSLCRETDVCNNGHTVIVYLKSLKAADPTAYRVETIPRSIMSGGPLPEGHEYELAEFRFHWGRVDTRGSEHTVNNKAFPMELHMVHWNSTLYPSLEEALGKPNGVSIIAIFIQIGREHAGLNILSEHLEDILYKGRQKTISTPFIPNCLLPDPMLRDYWTYEGSLTTPPCSENVTWVVFRYPLVVSRSQIEEFRRLRTHCKSELPNPGEDGALVDNFRPTQPINKRPIRASFQ